MTKDKSTATITLTKSELTSVFITGISIGVCFTSLVIVVIGYLLY